MLAATFKPERGAEATTAPSESQASRGGRTAADPYEANKLAHRCSLVIELEVA